MRRKKKGRGFASMGKERLRQIVSKAGKTAHQLGRAHTWTREEASAAGRKSVKARTARKFKEIQNSRLIP